MLRLRLATLALATGFLFTLSGCCSFYEDGRLFPRLFNYSARSGPTMHAGCECQDPHAPHMMMSPAAQGPLLPGSGATVHNVPIITNIPANQPPQVFKVPTAPTTPYVPAN